ncbi:methyltransferase [Dictyobacter vulcani]|uniref:Methyltransferase n=1 Tax=Dictyobacter vulcani TaxID=2607529 RepID=A0A5J4KKW9_9CHLR|nr:methyltransferase domain-containing protein [Dictyobacter vulcani]GER90398.1 methyltransferase [Dictyobacter vulcani]
MNADENDPKARVAAFYSRIATTYDQIGPTVFTTFGQRIVERTAILPGSRVLDVAAGRGANLFAAADKVGSTGEVVGIDIAPAMVQETQTLIEQRGLLNVSMQLMDAEQLTFADNSFDHVLCNFAIFFFPQLQQTLNGFCRVLKPQGTLTVTLPASGDARWRWYNELIGTYYEQYQLPLPPLATGAQPLLDVAAFTDLLKQAGFSDIHSTIEEAEFIYADEEEWWKAKWTHGERYPLENMPAEMLKQFRPEVLERIKELQQPDGYHEKWRIHCVIGQK